MSGQVLADQLSLSQPEGSDFAPTLLLAHLALGLLLFRIYFLICKVTEVIRNLLVVTSV
jgi:hypothetical protein